MGTEEKRKKGSVLAKKGNDTISARKRPTKRALVRFSRYKTIACSKRFILGEAELFTFRTAGSLDVFVQASRT